MDVRIWVALGFLGVVVVVPLAFVLWARRAVMFSGRGVDYDGPVSPSEATGPPRGGLSEDESIQWNELTEVTWHLPARPGGGGD